MTLRSFVNTINLLVELNPDLLDMEVLAASDDEGSSYNPILYSPSIGWWTDGEFIQKAPNNEDHENLIVNAICIN